MLKLRALRKMHKWKQKMRISVYFFLNTCVCSYALDDDVFHALSQTKIYSFYRFATAAEAAAAATVQQTPSCTTIQMNALYTNKAKRLQFSFFPSPSRTQPVCIHCTCFFLCSLLVMLAMCMLVSWTDTINKMFVSFGSVVCSLVYTLVPSIGALIRFGVCASCSLLFFSFDEWKPRA